MPWPGYEPERGDATLLEWSWAAARLDEARRYWLATARADGSAHLRAVWAAWVDGRLAFSTGRATRKARNLAVQPRCSLAIEAGDDSVVVEGVAEELTDRARIDRADAAYAAKYGSSMLVGDSPVFEVRPVLVIGFREDHPSVRPTRWRF
jgi:pyridoxine/pyridoxamine 5'-phosphate oxidase